MKNKMDYLKEIRCIECGNWHVLKYGEYEFLSGFKILKVVGYFYKCDYCGDVLLTPEICSTIDNEIVKVNTEDGK